MLLVMFRENLKKRDSILVVAFFVFSSLGDFSLIFGSITNEVSLDPFISGVRPCYRNLFLIIGYIFYFQTILFYEPFFAKFLGSFFQC